VGRGATFVSRKFNLRKLAVLAPESKIMKGDMGRATSSEMGVR